MTLNPSFRYRHLGGSLPLEDPTYVVRDADTQLYQALRDHDFCYVLNSRQMGKSSLRVRVMQQLQADGIACGVLDLSAMGTESTESAWYKGLAYRIMRNFRAAKARPPASTEKPFDWRRWWKAHDFLSPVQQLAELIQEGLLTTVTSDIVIFIDEIDSVLSLDFSTDDFFAWIRSCYNNRADDANYRRLTFCLLGVATPGDLIADKKRTPFNVGRAIALDGFEFHQAQTALQPGFIQANIPEPETVLRRILDWTGGQPFLTQKLCQLTLSHWTEDDSQSPNSQSPDSQSPTARLDAIVQAHILTNWESHDEPEHLRTIRDRFYAHPERTNRLLGLYQQILAHQGIKSDDSPEQRELRLTGLTVKRQNQLQVFNTIYQHIFDADWVSQALTDIRPYAQSFDGWVASNGQDATYLLSDVELAAAKAWASGKSLSDRDYAYLAACQEAETEQAEAALAVEAQAKEVLAEANQKANRRIRLGVGVLGLAAALLTGSLIFSAQTVQSARGEAAAAREVAEKERLAASNSRVIAAEEKENAQLARQAVEDANLETEEANTTAQLAREAAQSALADADAANQTAQQAQAEAESANQETQNARAETTQAIAERDQTIQDSKLLFAEVNKKVIEQTNRLITQTALVRQARLKQRELTVGNQLERSALSLIRTSTNPTTETLTEAIRLGETLQPFLADSRSLSDYPAVAPILALQTLLTKMPKGDVVTSYGTRINSDQVIQAWFSEDASRYATIHRDDSFEETYLQFWNDRGEPMEPSVPVQTTFSSGVVRPLSFYLTSQRSPSRNRGQDLLAIKCDNQTICVKDFNQNLEHRQLERVPGEKAAFNPETTELATLDKNNVLRRWTLFKQDRWIDQQISELQLPVQTDEMYFTSDGRHVWTHQYQQGQQDKILVFNLEGQLIKTHQNPRPGYQPSQYLPFSPEGDLVLSPEGEIIDGTYNQIDLSQFPGQGRQQRSLPIASLPNSLLDSPANSSDTVSPIAYDFLQTTDHMALVQPLRDTQRNSRRGAMLQFYDADEQLVSEYIAQDKSITLFPQPQGNLMATLECDLTETHICLAKVWNAEGQIISTVEVLSRNLRWTPQGQYISTWDNEQLHLTEVEQFTTSIYRTGGRLISFHTDATSSDDTLYFLTNSTFSIDLWNTAARFSPGEASPSPITSSFILGQRTRLRTAWYEASSQKIVAAISHLRTPYVGLLTFSPGQEDSVEFLLESRVLGDRNWNFYPVGDYIAVSRGNGELQLWNLEGNLIATFVGHTGFIDQVEVSPDGSQLLTYSQTDKTVRFWDLNGRQIAQYESELAPAINADWSKLITIEQQPRLSAQIPQTQLKVWKLDSLETLLADACQRLKPYLENAVENPYDAEENQVCN